MAKPELKWFYNSNEWKNPKTGKRIMALKRDHFTCQMCGARATEVHHKIELSADNVRDRNISLNMENLLSLCHECHQKITKNEHFLAKNDCNFEFFFDKNGYLQQRHPPPQMLEKSRLGRPSEGY